MKVGLLPQELLGGLVCSTEKCRSVDKREVCSKEWEQSGEYAEYQLRLFTTKEVLLVFTLSFIKVEFDTASVERSSPYEEGISQDNESDHENFDLNPAHEGFLRPVQEFKCRSTSIEIADNGEVEDLREDAKDLHDEPVSVCPGWDLGERTQMEGPKDEVEHSSKVDPEPGTGRLPFQLVESWDLVAIERWEKRQHGQERQVRAGEAG